MSTPLNQCTKCQKTLNIPFITNYCNDCFGKEEKSFRGELRAYHETNEQRPDGQIGWSKEKNAWITLWDQKQRVVYTPKNEEPNDNPNTTSKCGGCQGEFTKQGDEYLYWVEEGGDGTPYCCSCKDKKEQSSGHRSSMKPMTSSDPNIGFISICRFCHQSISKSKEHNYKDGKWIVKHNCEGKCWGYYGSFGLHEKCEKSNTYKWTQENINLLWDKTYKQGMCPECRIKSLNWDANVREDEEAKKTLVEVKKLIGEEDENKKKKNNYQIPDEMQMWL